MVLCMDEVAPFSPVNLSLLVLFCLSKKPVGKTRWLLVLRMIRLPISTSIVKKGNGFKDADYEYPHPEIDGQIAEEADDCGVSHPWTAQDRAK